MIETFKQRLTVKRKEKSGGRNDPVDSKMAKKVKRRPNMWIRDVTSKSKLSIKRSGLHFFNVQDERQNVSAKTRARKIYTQLLTILHCIVICDFRQLVGQEYFVAKYKFNVPDNDRKKKILI